MAKKLTSLQLCWGKVVKETSNAFFFITASIILITYRPKTTTLPLLTSPNTSNWIGLKRFCHHIMEITNMEFDSNLLEILHDVQT